MDTYVNLISTSDGIYVFQTTWKMGMQVAK